MDQIDSYETSVELNYSNILGYYVALGGLKPTFRDYLSLPFSMEILETGVSEIRTDSPETSVLNRPHAA